MLSFLNTTVMVNNERFAYTKRPFLQNEVQPGTILKMLGAQRANVARPFGTMLKLQKCAFRVSEMLIFDS